MKTLNIKFEIKNGKIHIKCPKVTLDEYKRIADHIHKVVTPNVIQTHNFKSSINVEL